MNSTSSHYKKNYLTKWYSSKIKIIFYTLLQKQIAKFQSIYPPNHTAANPNGYVNIPDVVENIEKANLQKSDHRYKIRADILKMSEHKKKKRYIDIMK